MLDTDPCFFAHSFKNNLDLGVKCWREVRLPPRKHQAMRRFPLEDPTDLEDFPPGSCLDQASALTWLE